MPPLEMPRKRKPILIHKRRDEGRQSSFAEKGEEASWRPFSITLTGQLR